MQFYKIDVNYKRTEEENAAINSGGREAREEERSSHQEIAEKTAAFNAKLGQDEAIFFARRIGQHLRISRWIFCVFAMEKVKVLPLYRAFLKEAIKFEGEVTLKNVSEISFEEIARLLTDADHSDYIYDDDDFLERIGLTPLVRRREFGGIEFGENLIKDRSREELEEAAKHFMIDEDFLPELDRIYQDLESKKRVARAHPVHYVVKTDNIDLRREACRMLLSALYSQKRLTNRRYAFMDVDPDSEINAHALETLYSASAGGAVIIRYNGAGSGEGSYAGNERGLIEMLGYTANRFRHKVLTVLCFPKECSKAKQEFFEMMPDMRTVEIGEELVGGEKAEGHLRAFCKEYHVRPGKALLNKLGTEKYTGTELEHLFTEWYDEKIRKECFPQYREIGSAKEVIVKEKPKGSAYDELMEMVGLDSAKKVINDALSYFKAQKVFADKGMVVERPAMHCVFTGNPGSAKTTAARLFAGVLKENGVLSKGTFLEVGRGDIIGKYVGHTAPLVKSKFKAAEGGVLFIDEAYSLVDDRDGMYGDEAINTIVQEMENHRDDVMVIFAGYPDKMEGFLNKNPGLRSRIAFHVSFEDYNTEELMGIAELISGKKGLNLTLGAKQKLKNIFDEARLKPDFGNGRFVRNILEQAKMAQASRLLRMDLDKVTKEDVATITEEDIQMPEAGKKDMERKVIGFSA